jgi:hypothetical protein
MTWAKWFAVIFLGIPSLIILSMALAYPAVEGDFQTPTPPCPTPYSNHCYEHYTPIPTWDGTRFWVTPTTTPEPYPGPDMGVSFWSWLPFVS